MRLEEISYKADMFFQVDLNNVEIDLQSQL